MPTHSRGIKAKDAKDWIEDEEVEEMKEEPIKARERFVTGPHGEKRPTSSLASIAWAVQIATGQREEEYVDGRKTPPKKKVRIL